MDGMAKQLQNVGMRPATPGEILREDVLPALGLSQGELAQRLGVSRSTVNDMLLEKRPVTVDMAWRLGRLLGNGAALWIDLQRQVDTWDALHIDASKYEYIEPLRKVG